MPPPTAEVIHCVVTKQKNANTGILPLRAGHSPDRFQNRAHTVLVCKKMPQRSDPPLQTLPQFDVTAESKGFVGFVSQKAMSSGPNSR
jgi:hypothetical protein